MQVTLADSVFNFNNETDSVDEIFKEIQSHADHNNLLLGYMIIDGEVIYDDYYDYITERIENIAHIEVKFKTLKELLDDTIISTNQYLSRVTPDVKLLADEFYQSVTKETWTRFSYFLEGLQSICQMIQSIYQNKQFYANWNDYYQFFGPIRDETENLEQAIQRNDTVLIADILTYEILPALNSLYDMMNQTIDSGVKANDLN